LPTAELYNLNVYVKHHGIFQTYDWARAIREQAGLTEPRRSVLRGFPKRLAQKTDNTFCKFAFLSEIP
jgi:hypothetical protein